LTISQRARAFVPLATIVVAAIATIQCGSSSSPTASTGLGVASVALNAASVVAGSSPQGTIRLTSMAAAGGASVSLVSSNTSVAIVQAPVMVEAGSSTATFTVTTMAAGTATITASLNGSSQKSGTLTVTASLVSLASLSLSSSSVVGGDQVNGTVTLTGAAPAGGAAVSLSASDPVTLPSSVTVPAGSTSTTFIISTRAVGGTIASTIGASYGGNSGSSVLTVTGQTVATASFGVTGPTESETCTLSAGATTLNCTFNGSTSSAPNAIIAWDWTYGITAMLAKSTTGQTLENPAFNCSLIPLGPLPAGNPGWLTMTVTLKIHDSGGNVSAVVSDPGVRLLPPPTGSCGY
jgi:hypothetical protein